ncbi:hypothetical protein [Pedobacter duraquae]|uniref:hypothetical protein n=1 Tax=Pedobacter duraquae TaxID=425511 RepID=UPI00105B6336|nr:hypothetical protein [Pedobacter duraquae]
MQPFISFTLATITNYPPYQNFPTLTANEVVLRQVTSTDADEIMEMSYYNGIPATDPSEAMKCRKR